MTAIQQHIDAIRVKTPGDFASARDPMGAYLAFVSGEVRAIERLRGEAAVFESVRRVTGCEHLPDSDLLAHVGDLARAAATARVAGVGR